MAEFPALPLWTDAYLGDTRHLTLAEHGAYLLLLMIAWRTPDCALPNDDAWLGRVIGDPKNWPRLKHNVMAFWTLGEDGKWHQKRLHGEREFVLAKSASAREAGKASALKRLGSRPTVVAKPFERNANAASTPTPTPTPIVNNTPAFAEEFDKHFWPLYPVKEAKAAARKAFGAARRKVGLETILDGVRKLLAAGKDPKFIKHPATWLNAECWADENTPQMARHAAGLSGEDQGASDQWWIRNAKHQALTGACIDGKFRQIPPHIKAQLAKEQAHG